MPVVEELLVTRSEQSDPLHEKSFSPVKGIVHRYPEQGSVHCYPRFAPTTADIARDHIRLEGLINSEDTIIEKAFNYISSHKEVRDVLL